MQRVVVPGSRLESWTVVGDNASPVGPAERYLAFLTDVGRSLNTVKAYAHDLKDWFAFLAGRSADWRDVRLEDVGEPPLVQPVTQNYSRLVAAGFDASRMRLSRPRTRSAGEGQCPDVRRCAEPALAADVVLPDPTDHHLAWLLGHRRRPPVQYVIA